MLEDIETKPNIIIDNGSGYIKTGFSGEEEPRAVFPTLIGQPKNQCIKFGAEKDFFVGREAEEKSGILNLKYPIEQGIINDWNDMENIWNYLFTRELRVDPSEHNVMITEASINPKIKREKMAQIMFETFNVHGLYISKTAPLSLYASGKSTGLSVESGDTITQFVPVFDGHMYSNSSIIMNLGGRDITDNLVDILYYDDGDYLTPSPIKREIAKEIKEKICYVALDFEHEKYKYQDINYEMPDGTEIKVKAQRYKAPEILFHPEMYRKEVVSFNINSFSKEKPVGIGEKCCDSINKSDNDIRRDLYQCIVLSGGTSMFPGLPERLTKEIHNFAPESMKYNVKVIAVPDRKYSVWNGGSILSSISTFKYMWITRDEYNEWGNSIVHRKSF